MLGHCLIAANKLFILLLLETNKSFVRDCPSTSYLTSRVFLSGNFFKHVPVVRVCGKYILIETSFCLSSCE